MDIKKTFMTIAIAALICGCGNSQTPDNDNDTKTTAEVAQAVTAMTAPRSYRAYLAPELIEGVVAPSPATNNQWVMLYANEGDQFDHESINTISTIPVAMNDSLATYFLHDWAFFLDEGYPIDDEYCILVDASNEDDIKFSLVKEEE